MVKVIIERRCRPDKEAEIESILVELRTRAMQQPGFISGETLKSVNDPMLWLVISTWVDDDTWTTWENSPSRGQIISKMEPFMYVPEKVSIFNYIRHRILESAPAVE